LVAQASRGTRPAHTGITKIPESVMQKVSVFTAESDAAQTANDSIRRSPSARSRRSACAVTTYRNQSRLMLFMTMAALTAVAGQRSQVYRHSTPWSHHYGTASVSSAQRSQIYLTISNAMSASASLPLFVITHVRIRTPIYRSGYTCARTRCRAGRAQLSF
jgi:hypothetical protein